MEVRYATIVEKLLGFYDTLGLSLENKEVRCVVVLRGLLVSSYQFLDYEAQTKVDKGQLDAQDCGLY